MCNLKKPELLLKYMCNLVLEYSICKCAKEAGVSDQTSFDWRHKIVSSFDELCPCMFDKVVEIKDMFSRVLEKKEGSR